MYKEKEYWNERYKNGENSGAGSYGKSCELKVSAVRDICKNKNFSVIDIGCGDFNIGNKLSDLFPFYEACDISEVIIKKNIESFKDIKFYVYNAARQKLKNKYDVILCLDVLFHIANEDDFNYLINNLLDNFNNYLIISTWDKEGMNTGEHVFFRNIEDKIKNFIYDKIRFNDEPTKVMYIIRKKNG